MKKRFLVFLTILTLVLSLLSALSVNDKLKFSKPGKKEVMFISRLTVNTQFDFEKIRRRYNLKPIKEDDCNVYASPVFWDRDDEISGHNLNKNGSFCATTHEFPKNRQIDFYTRKYYILFSKEKSISVRLPWRFQIKCEDDVQYVYVGSFYYDIDPETYEVLKVTKVDEYEEAVAWLNENFPDKKGDRQVIRVESTPLEDD